MAGPPPSPWTWLLLAALLSASFPGDMGESGTPLQHPLGEGTPSWGPLMGCLTQTFNSAIQQVDQCTQWGLGSREPGAREHGEWGGRRCGREKRPTQNGGARSMC